MKTTTLLGVMILAAAFAGPADAIYKCTTAKGVVYQDRPCREGSESDVQLVIPTGEVAPKNMAAPESGSQGAAGRAESRPAATRNGRTPSDDAASMTKQGDKRAGDSNAGTRAGEAAANASSDARKKDALTTADNSNAIQAAEQARKTEASAKYYAAEGFSAGGDTPAHMTCESANGEKRVFYLSNGKLTSI